MTYADEVLADDPLAWYRLSEVSGTAMVDWSGNGRGGTYSGTYTLNESGLLSTIDPAVDFGGGKAVVAGAAWMNPAAWSVEAWVQLDATGTRTIVSRNGTSNGGSVWALRVDSTTLHFYRWDASNNFASITKTGMVVGQIYHVVATYDGTTARLYVDGVLEGSAAAAIKATSTQQLTVAGWEGSGETWDGRLDEVAFYGSALSLARVQAHHTAGTAAPSPSYSAAVLADSPLAFFPLDETSGGFADDSGNAKTIAWDLDAGLAAGTQGNPGPVPTNPAAGLNGSNNRLGSDAAVSSSKVTLEVWYKGTDAAGLLASGRGSGTRSLTLHMGAAPLDGVGAGQVALGISGDSLWRGIRSSTAVNDGRWHHIVGVMDATDGVAISESQLALYIDGEWQGPTTLGGTGSLTAPLTTSGYKFGHHANDSQSGFLSGRLARLAVYGTALTAARIAAHFAAGGGLIPPPVDTAPTGALSAAVMELAPLAYWRLDDSPGATVVLDYSGNERDGSVTGAVTLGQPSLTPSETTTAADFATGRVLIPPAAWVGVDYLSLFGRMKPDGVTGSRTIAANDNVGSGSTLSWRLRIDGSKLQALVYASGGLYIATGATTLVVGQTYSVGVTFDGTIIRVYLDGVQDGSVAVPAGVIRKSTEGVHLGALGNGVSEPFDGVLDEIAMWGTALTAGDMADLHAAALAPPGPPGTTYADTVLEDTPLTYHRLGEASGTSAADASGNARTGTYVGGPTLGASGLIQDGNAAVTLDGTDDRVTVPATGLDSTEDFTVEAWVKTANASTKQQIACRWDNTNSSGQRWTLQLDSGGRPFLHIKTAGEVFYNVSGPASIADNARHHVVAVCTATTLEMFVDGVSVGTATRAGTLLGGGAALTLGATQNAAEFFAGTLDEVATYDTALTAARILDHYSIGLDLTAYHTAVLEDGPLGYWRLGDGGEKPTVSAATASSNFGSEPPAYAFDGNPATFWTTNGTATGWVRAQLAAAAVVNVYAIRRRDTNTNRNPKDWTFEGSNDGTTWTVLDTRTGITWPTVGETKIYTSGNATAYLYYRLNVTANNGDTYLSVAELILGDPRTSDSSGNNRPGYMEGLLTAGVAGLLVDDTDTAFDFAGGVVEVAAGTWLNVTHLSVEALVRLDSVGQAILVEHDPQMSSPRPWHVRVDGGKFQMLVNGGALTLASVATLAIGTTYHLVATFDGTTGRLYIDGELDTSAAYVAAIGQAPTQPLRIGGGLTGWRPNGILDEVAVYGTALSAERIAEHYLVATTGEGSGPAAPETPTATAEGESDATASGAATASTLVNGAGAAEGESDANAVAVTVAAGETRNRVGGRNRDGIGEATWEPPVVPIPAGLDLGQNMDVAHAFTVPVMDGARPVYSVASVEKAGQLDRIVVGGLDVTYFRGVPTPFPGFSLLEPMMYGPTVIALPQIAAAFERPGHGELRWMRKGAPVYIQRVEKATGEVVATDYRGLVVGYDAVGGSFALQVGGEATGRAALMNRQVPLFPGRSDVGYYVWRGLQHLGLKGLPFFGAETGIEVRTHGGTSMLEYLNGLVNMAQTTSGERWTLMPDRKGVYRMKRKDTTTIDGTVYADDARTVADLHRDIAEEPNRIFMTGVTPEGQRARFGAYPGLKQTDAPRYPMDDDSMFGQGTTDAQTDTGDGITVMKTRLVVTGYLSGRDAPGGYDSDMTRAVKALQREAGLNVTGNMGPNTWAALFDLNATGYSLKRAKILPAAERSVVRKWRRTSSGAIIGRNPDYDPSVPVVDRNVDVGMGYRRSQMREWAQAELIREDNWTGSITFHTGGLIDGEHVPGAPIVAGDLRRARTLRPGMNLWLPLFDGGTLVHVSAVTVDAAGVVRADVDTRARDAMEVWEVIARNRESRRSPYREWLRDHRASTETKDSTTVWDEVGGVLGDDVVVKGNRWTIFPVVAGEEGIVRSLRVRTNPNAEYVVAVFGQRIYPTRLRTLIGNPLTKAGAKLWAKESVRDQLDRSHLLLYVAGSNEQPCGYYPKSKQSEPDGVSGDVGYSPVVPLTGRWEDDAGFSYHTGDGPPVLWVAVWADRDTSIPSGRIMWNQLEAGS